MSRLYDLTLAVKGSKVKESIPYISNSLFRCGFDKFAMEVGKDDDNNQKLTVDIWKEICDESDLKICSILSKFYQSVPEITSLVV